MFSDLYQQVPELEKVALDSSILTKAEEILALSDKDLGLPCVYR